MKICVYAISKNEEKFVNRWVESMKEADEIYVLDTGSTDNTVKELKKLGVKVKQKKIDPWRFDNARNESLKLVPKNTDICVCTDLDEVFVPGWRKQLEKEWNKETTRASYNYNWSLDTNNKPLVNFNIEKIHTRKNYHWTHPVHEILTYEKENEIKQYINITLNHYPDNTKSRNSYLPLLELSVKEDPNDDRNMHYLGREYMYYGMYEKSIATLKKHLSLKSATWKDERAASLRFIGRCYKELKNNKEALIYYDKSIKEAPHLRDSYIEKAMLEYEQKNYIEVEKLCLKALQIKTHEKTYINEVFSWNETVYDLLSLSNYYQNKLDYALYFIEIALEINPYDQRLISNKEIFKQKEDN